MNSLFIMLQKRLLVSLTVFIAVLAANDASAQYNLEFDVNSYPSPPTGPSIAPVTGELRKNTTGTTFVSYTPAITVTAEYTVQTYTSVTGNTTGTGMQFGVTQNTAGTTPIGQNVWIVMGNVSTPSNTHFTSNPYGTVGTGMDITANYTFSMFNCTRPLQASSAATNGRHNMGKLRLVFNRPISNPVLHIVGLGGTSTSGGTLGFTTELELVTTGVTLSKLSGTTEFNITSNKVLNSATNPAATSGAGAATGSVRVTGNNIDTLLFDVFLRGDGGGTVWEGGGNYTGDRWLIGFSMSEPTISGNVYNDANALTDNTVNGSGTNAGGLLFINLVDNTTGLVAKVAEVASDGAYLFQDIQPAGFPRTYTAYLSTISGTVGSAPPATTLPANYTHTGNFLGTGTGGSNATPGILGSLTLTNAATVITNANFGIEQLPTPTGINQASQGNPGGTNAVSIVNGFSASDPDGTVSSITITTFPTNTTSLRVGTIAYYSGSLPGTCPSGFTCQLFPGGGVNVATNTSGVPTSAVTLDPIDGNVTPVVTFNTTDNAGKTSTGTSSFDVPFTVIAVSGNVWDDADGGATKNGAEQFVSGNNTSSGGSIVTGGNLYANLINAAGNVIATTQVAADGTYSFANAPANTTGLKIQLSTTQGTVDQAAPAVVIPAGWAATGNSVGAGNTASQAGAPTATINLTTAGTAITAQNFGIERLSTADVKSASISNPSVNQLITLDGGANPPILTGSDPEDQAVSGVLTGKKVSITSLPTNGQLWYNGVQVTATGTLPGSFNPSLLQFKATGSRYTTTTFQYAYVDAANIAGTPASYTLNWTVPLPLIIESFEAKVNGCEATLNWSTANEQNGAYYAVERSEDANNFRQIATVACAEKASRYSITVQVLASGNYFRLKRVATNGSAQYSNVVTAEGGRCGTKAISVAPNPVRDQVTVSGMTGANNRILLYNTMGAIVAERNSSSAEEVINVALLPAGVYLLQVTDGTGLTHAAIRIIKQ